MPWKGILKFNYLMLNPYFQNLKNYIIFPNSCTHCGGEAGECNRAGFTSTEERGADEKWFHCCLQ